MRSQGCSVFTALVSLALTPAVSNAQRPDMSGSWHREGRVAVFGEAAMFSAQVTGPNRSTMGMNAPVAAQNAPFLLNVMRWLARAPG